MRPFPTSHPRQHGFTLLEVAVTIVIVTVSLSMFARTIASSKTLDPVATETAMAASAARTVLEEMRNQPFGDLFVLYNDVPGDDPAGAGTAPGAHFDVPELIPVTTGGHVGTIMFPSTSGMLREDFVDSVLGMPRDLNADGNVDSANHASDAVLIPIRIRLDWIPKGSKDARRRFEMFTMYARY
jgi:prepilin-type N-terminal cleavage/methylation domain-containing protein